MELEPTLRFAERLDAMGKPVWVRFVLVPGPDRRPGEHRRVAHVRRADDQRRMGRGAALPPDGRVQMEGARSSTTSIADTPTPTPN